MSSVRRFFLTSLAMIAFASNSLLCRAALKQTSIDAASFTFLRIFSGAVALWIIMKMRNTVWKEAGTWPSAAALFAYAAAFSFALLQFVGSRKRSVRAPPISRTLSPSRRQRVTCASASMMSWSTLALSCVSLGLGAWIARAGGQVSHSEFRNEQTPPEAPAHEHQHSGLSAPSLVGSILMLGAGLAWGVYSLRGKAARDAIAATAGNFLRAVPFAAAVSIISLRGARVDLAGASYAVISGAITSGVGYVIWYSALPGLKAASAATVQLSVPVLAATGGILLLGEPITLRYVLASVAVLGGIALVVIEKRRRRLWHRSNP